MAGRNYDKESRMNLDDSTVFVMESEEFSLIWATKFFSRAQRRGKREIGERREGLYIGGKADVTSLRYNSESLCAYWIYSKPSLLNEREEHPLVRIQIKKQTLKKFFNLFLTFSVGWEDFSLMKSC